MALKQTTSQMKNLLAQIMQDIKKSEDGNKAAGQRVRTGTIQLEKIAKLFRKESIKAEKQTKGKKKPAKKAKVAKKPAKKAVAKKKPMKKPAAKRVAAPKKKAAKSKTTKKKTTTRKTTARARALSFKRKPTAKLPIKRKRAR